MDFALGNLLGFVCTHTHTTYYYYCTVCGQCLFICLLPVQVGLPATSWAATLTGTLMLLLTGKHLREYRIPKGQVTSPEINFHSRIKWAEANTSVDDV